MEIARLNIRQTLPRIGIRTQKAQLEMHTSKAELHGDYQAPRSNMGATQPTIEMDSYPSRHSYGYTNNGDFAKEYGQKGLQDLRQGRQYSFRPHAPDPPADCVIEDQEDHLSEEEIIVDHGHQGRHKDEAVQPPAWSFAFTPAFSPSLDKAVKAQ